MTLFYLDQCKKTVQFIYLLGTTLRKPHKPDGTNLAKTLLARHQTTTESLIASQFQVAPPNWTSEMKLGKFRKVPAVIKHAKRHLDPTIVPDSRGGRIWPIHTHWLFIPNTTDRSGILPITVTERLCILMI